MDKHILYINDIFRSIQLNLYKGSFMIKEPINIKPHQYPPQSLSSSLPSYELSVLHGELFSNLIKFFNKTILQNGYSIEFNIHYWSQELTLYAYEFNNAKVAIFATSLADEF